MIGQIVGILALVYVITAYIGIAHILWGSGWGYLIEEKGLQEAEKKMPCWGPWLIAYCTPLGLVLSVMIVVVEALVWVPKKFCRSIKS